jgi:hypothetical protein
MALEEFMGEGHHSELPLVVIDWLVQLGKFVQTDIPNQSKQTEFFASVQEMNRQSQFISAADCNRHVDNLMIFKKNCGSVIKFNAKNIPPSMIQVCSYS